MPDFGLSSPNIPHTFTIFQSTSNYFLQDNWTGAVTSFSNTDIVPVIEAGIAAIITTGANNDTVYGGSIYIQKGGYTQITKLDLTWALAARHGIKIIGEGEGTHISITPGSGSPLTDAIEVNIEAYSIINIFFSCNQYVTNIIKVKGIWGTSGRRTDYGRITGNMFEGHVGKYTGTTPTANQVAIWIDGSAASIYFGRILNNDFGAFDKAIVLDGGECTSHNIIGNTAINCEKFVVISNGSGQHTIDTNFVQGSTGVGTSGVEISGSGKNINIDNLTTELHKTATNCQAVLLNTGVTGNKIGNNVSNVFDNGTTWKTIRDSSGDLTTNVYDQNVIANGVHYQRFEDNIVKTNSAVGYNYFSGQARWYDNAYDHYYKITANSGYDLSADVSIEYPDMRTSGSGQMVVHNAPSVFSLKTINPTNNIMPFLNSYTNTIYQDGGVVKCRNNKTGVVTSNTNLDPLVTTILASGDPSLEIQSGTYNLSGGFTGWTMTNAVTIFMNQDTVIKVPAGFADGVFKFVSSNRGINIRGGSLDEQGAATYDWIGFKFTPTSPDGVVFNTIQDVTVTHAKHVMKFNTTDNGWVNNNRFVNILGDRCEYFAEFTHSGTFTFNLSGCCGNHFENCDLQAFADFPQTLGGIVGVNGQYNTFVNCKIWDLEAANASAPMMTITANAQDTIIIGGILTYLNFTDNGIDTKIIDNFKGLYSKQEINLKNTLNITVPNGGTGASDEVFRFGVSDAIDDVFTLENSTLEDGIYSCLFRMYQNSTASHEWTPGIWFQTLIKSSKDIANAIACNVISAHNIGNTFLANRAIFEIDNKFTQCYVFYPGSSDWTNKKFVNYREQYDIINTTPVTLNEYQQLLKVDASGGARTVNLPAAAGTAPYMTGKIYTIIKTDSSANTVTIDANGSETINGALTYLLTLQYQSVVLWCDGANWFVNAYSAERRGKSTASGNGSQTVFNVPHGLGAVPHSGIITCRTHTIATYTMDGTNIAVTLSSAPASAANNVIFDWSVVA
jgi:hypothetical protein